MSRTKKTTEEPILILDENVPVNKETSGRERLTAELAELTQLYERLKRDNIYSLSNLEVKMAQAQQALSKLS